MPKEKLPIQKNPASTLDDFMPPDKQSKSPDVAFKPKPFLKEDLDKKVGDPRKELTGKDKSKFKDVIEQAKNAIKNNSIDHKVSHGDVQNFDIDGVYYVYLRDESQKVAAKKDRLFIKNV